MGSIPAATTAGRPRRRQDAVILSANVTAGGSHLASNSAGSLWVINFMIVPGASGTTVLNLVPNASGITTTTNVTDGAAGYSHYTLSPAPTGVRRTWWTGRSPYAGTTTTVTSSSASAVYGTPVTFTATVSAQSGSTAPTAGSVDFFDTTTGTDLGLGTFGSSTGTTSTWTLTTGVKTFNVTAGDTITATYTAGTGFIGSSGTTTQTVTPLAITVTAATNTKAYDGTTSATATPTITAGSLVAGDTAAFSETFDTKNAGTARRSPRRFGQRRQRRQQLHGDLCRRHHRAITSGPITVTAVTNTKGYDGPASASATPTVTSGSLVGTDTSAFSETYPNTNSARAVAHAGRLGQRRQRRRNYPVTLVTNATG